MFTSAVYGGSRCCCQSVKAQPFPRLAVVLAVVPQMLFVAAAVTLYFKGVGIISAAGVLGGTLIPEGILALYLKCRKPVSQKRISIQQPKEKTPGTPHPKNEPSNSNPSVNPTTQPSSTNTAANPSVTIHFPQGTRLDSKGKDDRMTRADFQNNFNDNLQPFIDQALYGHPSFDPTIKKVDIFTNARPAKGKRVTLSDGTKTNGAATTEGDVLIQGPEDEAHFEQMFGIIVEKKMDAFVNLNDMNYVPAVQATVNKGKFTIHNEKEETIYDANNRKIVRSHCIVTNTATQEERRVCQYRFIGWPDGGACTVEELDILVKGVYDHHGADAKVLIHCKAGIGRTGTFEIARQIHRQYMAATDDFELNPYAMVEELRKIRPGAVQQSEQFELILDYIEYLPKSIPREKMPKTD